MLILKSTGVVIRGMKAHGLNEVLDISKPDLNLLTLISFQQIWVRILNLLLY